MQNIMSSSYLRRNVPMLIRKLRCILLLLAVSNFLLAESFLRSKLPSSQFEGEKSSNLCKNKSSILTERLSVQEKEFASRSLICRRSTCSAHRRHVFRRIGASRNHHGGRLLLGASAVRRCALFRGRKAQHADGRRQGHDGPQRAASPSGHSAIGL